MKASTWRPTILVTLGDPAGVGAEVTLKALNDPEISSLARWTLIGDLSGVLAAEESTNVRLNSLPVAFLDTHQLPTGRKIAFGELRAEYGRAAAAYVRVGTEMCLRGEAAAIVTAPLNKEAVTLSGMPFSGHTEYIAQLCGAKDSRMLLASGRLCVVHVSTHTSLRTACNLDVDRIVRTIELGHEGMRLLGNADPRIAVCGLNPHAGEHGLFGVEDAEFIAPAIEICQGRGIRVEGPTSPDTIFVRASRGSHDLIVAMYHDQGHIPMKLIDFEQTVNVSLGIPIIRTSVDHGTAFDIAGKNRASSANMKAAMKLATTMVVNRQLHPQ
jgi:4-phospho-D-threonate 3-dehydrogenase / 4-phospho-D-erythronate 3-dehydrogenase